MSHVHDRHEKLKDQSMSFEEGMKPFLMHRMIVTVTLRRRFYIQDAVWRTPTSLDLT